MFSTLLLYVLTAIMLVMTITLAVLNNSIKK
jgi:hypothetical protein